MVLELYLKFNGRVFSSFFKPGGIVFDIETSWLCVDMESYGYGLILLMFAPVFYLHIAPSTTWTSFMYPQLNICGTPETDANPILSLLKLVHGFSFP
jgi:hypothetical protein